MNGVIFGLCLYCAIMSLYNLLSDLKEKKENNSLITTVDGCVFNLNNIIYFKKSTVPKNDRKYEDIKSNTIIELTTITNEDFVFAPMDYVINKDEYVDRIYNKMIKGKKIKNVAIYVFRYKDTE